MTQTLSLTQARSRFSSLLDKADRLPERFIVTKNPTPNAVKSLEQGMKEARSESSTHSKSCSAKISDTRTSPLRLSRIRHPSKPERATTSKKPSGASPNIPLTANR